jgi:hypothetical protein
VSEPRPKPVHLTTVAGSFHAKVIAARLASEGVATQLRGFSEGPYPLPAVIDVLVPEGQLAVAREILLADAVDAVFLENSAPRRRRERTRRFRLRRREGR